jgi:hypothetical protein
VNSPNPEDQEVVTMGDRENESSQPEVLEQRLRAIEQSVQGQLGRFQEVVASQIGQVRSWFEQSQTGKQVQDIVQQIQEQAGHMWQEFEKRLQALDDARQALEDRISRQIDAVLSQQRSFARKVEAMAGTSGRTPARTASRKSATRRAAARRPAKKASSRKPAAKRTATKRSAAKRPAARRSTAKKSPARRSTKRSTAKRSSAKR